LITPFFDQVDALRGLKREARVLLDEEHGDALALDLEDRSADRLDEGGHEALRGLVDEQKPGLRPEAPRHRQHLLLAAAQGLALVGQALGERREQLDDPSQVVVHAPAAVHVEPRHLEILVHAQVGEDPALFRDIADAELHDAVGRQARCRCRST
jgi:hypothetical protein